ncbi:MAG: type II secretion system F family protein, partial [Lachnospiraceae bacterium]|nr:type II secretion system F family protein [Lachnospiraceae bacterium]
MASYAYEAIDSLGKIVKGSVEADNEEGVKAELKRQNITPISIKSQGILNKDLNIDIGGKPTVRDLSVFCRQFVAMFRAGVSMIDALKMLTEATENKKLRKACDEVRIAVEKGEALSMAFKEHSKIFPPIMVNMTAAGEASGSLDVAMDRIALQLEKSNKTKATIKKAMMYPIIVLIVMLAVVIVMLVKVIPSYSEMFKDLETDLPAITKGVQAVSDFLIHQWYIVVPVIIAIVVGLIIFNRTDTGKHVTGKIAISIPAIKNLVVKNASAQMARTLSTLVGAGIPLVEAVEIAGNVMDNVYFKEAMYN